MSLVGAIVCLRIDDAVRGRFAQMDTLAAGAAVDEAPKGVDFNANETWSRLNADPMLLIRQLETKRARGSEAQAREQARVLRAQMKAAAAVRSSGGSGHAGKEVKKTKKDKKDKRHKKERKERKERGHKDESSRGHLRSADIAATAAAVALERRRSDHWTHGLERLERIDRDGRARVSSHCACCTSSHVDHVVTLCVRT